MDQPDTPDVIKDLFGTLNKKPRKEVLTDKQKAGKAILDMLKQFKK